MDVGVGKKLNQPRLGLLTTLSVTHIKSMGLDYKISKNEEPDLFRPMIVGFTDM